MDALRRNKMSSFQTSASSLSQHHHPYHSRATLVGNRHLQLKDAPCVCTKESELLCAYTIKRGRELNESIIWYTGGEVCRQWGES